MQTFLHWQRLILFEQSSLLFISLQKKTFLKHCWHESCFCYSCHCTRIMFSRYVLSSNTMMLTLRCTHSFPFHLKEMLQYYLFDTYFPLPLRTLSTSLTSRFIWGKHVSFIHIREYWEILASWSSRTDQ